MPVPMKIFKFPLTLALSLGLTGWMFASYRQNQEQFRQAGQKTADLEKEKSSLEEEIKKYQAILQDSAYQDMPAMEKQEQSNKQQIIEQERNTKTIQRLLQEGEQQRHALKIREVDLNSRPQDLTKEKKKEGGSAVHAPKSIAGATITGHLADKYVVSKRLSAIPPAIFPIVFAEAGAIRYKSAHNPKST